ncbi:MAG TPA: hypothetical protein VGP07_02945 [Polyangia bacterium]|jgi:hypothetical protein
MTPIAVKQSRRLVNAPLLTVGALIATLGCDYTYIPAVEGTSTGPAGLGTMCTLGTDEVPSTSIAIDSQSNTCPSGICLRPAEEKATDTAALCTQVCQSDKDCQGGASHDPGSPMDQLCQTGFTCQAIVPNLASVAYACQKLCVCRDFLDSSQGTAPPAGCP